ncbi:MAG: carbonic anhydrase [Candidatus Paceibacterota bacterium]
MAEEHKHTCSSILFKCIDFRMQTETRRWLHENNLAGDCDVVSLAGASKGISDNDPEVAKLMLEQIQISHDLHGAKQVVLIHHSDCGRYKNDYCFESPEKERETQVNDMKKSEEIIKKNFPDITVKKVWAQMNDPEGKSVDFQIVD